VGTIVKVNRKNYKVELEEGGKTCPAAAWARRRRAAWPA